MAISQARIVAQLRQQLLQLRQERESERTLQIDAIFHKWSRSINEKNLAKCISMDPLPTAYQIPETRILPNIKQRINSLSNGYRVSAYKYYIMISSVEVYRALAPYANYFVKFRRDTKTIHLNLGEVRALKQLLVHHNYDIKAVLRSMYEILNNNNKRFTSVLFINNMSIGYNKFAQGYKRRCFMKGHFSLQLFRLNNPNDITKGDVTDGVPVCTMAHGIGMDPDEINDEESKHDPWVDLSEKEKKEIEEWIDWSSSTNLVEAFYDGKNQ
eukprot:240702_1